MKAILIDPYKKEITIVEYTGELKNLYDLLECATVEAPIRYDNGDIMYCDEEAWIFPKDTYAGFDFKGWSYAILGKALVVGSGDEGEDVTCISQPEDFKDICWRDDIYMKHMGERMGIL